MSVKAQALVWDLKCPKIYGDLGTGPIFKPSHKYVLIAYADHADHNGRNIWPAIPTIARKTGFDDRTVQRLTADLEAMGLLIEDGRGPRGTNKWRLPYNDTGDKLSPVTICQGDKTEDSLGDIPSGDIPSGDKLTPELNKPEPLDIQKGEEVFIWERLKDILKGDTPRRSFQAYIEPARAVRLAEHTLVIAVPDETARDWMTDRTTSTIEQSLIGITGRELAVEFIVRRDDE